MEKEKRERNKNTRKEWNRRREGPIGPSSLPWSLVSQLASLSSSSYYFIVYGFFLTILLHWRKVWSDCCARPVLFNLQSFPFVCLFCRSLSSCIECSLLHRRSHRRFLWGAGRHPSGSLWLTSLSQCQSHQCQLIEHQCKHILVIWPLASETAATSLHCSKTGGQWVVAEFSSPQNWDISLWKAFSAEAHTNTSSAFIRLVPLWFTMPGALRLKNVDILLENETKTFNFGENVHGLLR